MQLTTKTQAHIAVIIANFFFGICYSCVKYLNDHGLINAFGLCITRVAFAMLLFWILILGSKTPWGFNKKDGPLFLLCAVTGIVINQLLFIKGLTLTSTLHATLLVLLTPILVSFSSALMATEKMSVYKWLGLLLGVIGAVILVLSKNYDKVIAKNQLLGDVLIFLNALSYTVYFIKVKKLMSTYNPLHVVRWVFTIGFVIMLPFTFNYFTQINWQNYTPFAWAILACIVFGATFIAYSFNLFAIKNLGAAVSGNYIYTQPIYALIIAVMFLQETITPSKIIAALLILIGVYISGKQ